MQNAYAVIFTAEFGEDLGGYEATLAQIRKLAAAQPGFIGIESVTEGRREITVSYWRSLEDIHAWKAHPDHRRAQEMGRRHWYRRYKVEVVAIERQYSFGG